ncbi:MAG: hypothetical protein ABSF22_23475 [Bryobacteraceae bacterium]
MTDLHLQILVELGKCVDQRVSLDTFRQWLVPRSFDIEQSGQADAIELVHHIDGILAEASSAGWSDADLRDEMAKVVREHSMIAPGHNLRPSMHS